MNIHAKRSSGLCNPLGRAPIRSLLPLAVGERIRILDPASNKAGHHFGIVTAPRNRDLGPNTITFIVEGAKRFRGDDGVCILPRNMVERA